MQNFLEKIQRRHVFLFTVALFFPVVMQAINFKAENSSSDFTLQWLFLIVFLTINYLYIEYTKNWSQKILNFIDATLFLNIFLFVPVFVVITQVPVFGVKALVYAELFKYSFSGIVLCPILIFLLCTVNLVRNFTKS